MDGELHGCSIVRISAGSDGVDRKKRKIKMAGCVDGVRFCQAYRGIRSV